MAAKPLRFERTGIRQFDQFQRELADALSVLLASPFASGVAIRGVSLVATVAKVVQHPLGHPPANVIPILSQGSNAGGFVVTSMTSTSFIVKCPQTVTADFWVS